MTQFMIKRFQFIKEAFLYLQSKTILVLSFRPACKLLIIKKLGLHAYFITYLSVRSLVAAPLVCVCVCVWLGGWVGVGGRWGVVAERGRGEPQ